MNLQKARLGGLAQIFLISNEERLQLSLGYLMKSMSKLFIRVLVHHVSCLLFMDSYENLCIFELTW